MTDKLTKDFYMVHYNYYTHDNTVRGEGICYISTPIGTGVRKADIEEMVSQVAVGLSNSSAGTAMVVPTSVNYLTSCSTEEFNASNSSSNAL